MGGYWERQRSSGVLYAIYVNRCYGNVVSRQKQATVRDEQPGRKEGPAELFESGFCRRVKPGKLAVSSVGDTVAAFMGVVLEEIGHSCSSAEGWGSVVITIRIQRLTCEYLL